jgi:hypothetical protein
MSYYKKQTSFLKGVVIYLIVLALILGSLVAVGWGSAGFTNWNTKTWFNNWTFSNADSAAPDNPDGKDDKAATTGNFLINDIEENHGISLMSTTAEPAAVSDDYIGATYLKATVNGDNTTFDSSKYEFDWHVSFANQYSSWASGKSITDYVIIAEDQINAGACFVFCLQAFSEPVIVKVSLSGYADYYYATCQFDFMRNITSYSPKLTFYENTNSTDWYATQTINGNYIGTSGGNQHIPAPTKDYLYYLDMEAYCDVTFGDVGTVLPSDLKVVFNLQNSVDLGNSLVANGLTNSASSFTEFATLPYTSISGSTLTCGKSIKCNFFYTSCNDLYSYPNQNTSLKTNNAVTYIKAMQESNDAYPYYMTVGIYDGDTQLKAASYAFNILIDPQTYVTSVSLNQSAYTFYNS